MEDGFQVVPPFNVAGDRIVGIMMRKTDEADRLNGAAKRDPVLRA